MTSTTETILYLIGAIISLFVVLAKAQDSVSCAGSISLYVVLVVIAAALATYLYSCFSGRRSGYARSYRSVYGGGNSTVFTFSVFLFAAFVVAIIFTFALPQYSINRCTSVKRFVDERFLLVLFLVCICTFTLVFVIMFQIVYSRYFLNVAYRARAQFNSVVVGDFVVGVEEFDEFLRCVPPKKNYAVFDMSLPMFSALASYLTMHGVPCCHYIRTDTGRLFSYHIIYVVDHMDYLCRRGKNTDIVLVDLDQRADMNKVIDGYVLGFCNARYEPKSLAFSAVRTSHVLPSCADIEMVTFIERCGKFGLLEDTVVTVFSLDKIFQSMAPVVRYHGAKFKLNGVDM